jgi:hypothetical protein
LTSSCARSDCEPTADEATYNEAIRLFNVLGARLIAPPVKQTNKSVVIFFVANKVEKLQA